MRGSTILWIIFLLFILVAIGFLSWEQVGETAGDFLSYAISQGWKFVNGTI